MTTTDAREIGADAAVHAGTIRRLIDTVETRVIGQRDMIEGLVIGLLTNGHVLLEGVPGLAKTLTISTLAQAIRGEFSRLQFTPDLLPADLIGTLIYDPRSGEFQTKKGPVFANLVLADEINRAPAKVQSALLEAMQERQVTLGERTHTLPDPFLVLATQNPVEQEGTYPLPEAQVDRFMLKLTVGYLGKEDERAVLDLMASTERMPPIEPAVSLDEVRGAREAVDSIYIDAKVKDYIVDVVHATREPRSVGLEIGHLIDFGASPRATIALALTAKARAFLEGRGFAAPQDVKAMAPAVLRHRIVASYEAEAERFTSDDLVKQILEAVPVP